MTNIDGNLVESRLRSLIYRFLDAELFVTALFFAERLFSMDGTNHDSRHLLANVMLKLQQPHTALHLATRPQDDPCVGCLFLASQCNERLRRPKKAMDLAAKALKIMTTADASGNERPQGRLCCPQEDPTLMESLLIADNPKHVAQDIPDIAIMHCKAGLLAARASLKTEAVNYFTSALTLEPLLWEAWLGLCNLGL